MSRASFTIHTRSFTLHTRASSSRAASSLVARASSAVTAVRIARSLCHPLRRTSSFRCRSRRVSSIGRHHCRAPSAALVASAPFIAVVTELSPPPLLSRLLP
ncbi:uncharacterized protein DS421_3g78410 [Arachis hypogaea]|nr:uncharacterized protein DS421_3g78410 [Arachis hypogaea]